MITFNFRLIDVFPNPVHDVLNIHYNANFATGDHLTVTITDATAKRLLLQRYATSGAGFITLHMPPGIANGIYILQVINDKGDKQSKKIFIHR
jgi:hypothetical protein